jgi:hypothetical protein
MPHSPPGRKRDGPRKGRLHVVPLPTDTDVASVAAGAGPEHFARAAALLIAALHRRASVALSDERDLHLRVRHRYWREGWRLGAEHGWKQGYEAACADQEAAWHEMAWRIAHGDHRSYAELRRVRGEAPDD